MTDKMNLEKANKIVDRWENGYHEVEPRDYSEAQGFIKGFESRQAEVGELKKEIEQLKIEVKFEAEHRKWPD